MPIVRDKSDRPLASHSSNLDAKLTVRREVMNRCHAVGRAYIPFCGPGEIVRHLNIPPSTITAVDSDAAMIRMWDAFAPESSRHVADAAKFKQWGEHDYAFGDFDAFGWPYLAIDNFLRNAPLCEEIAIAMTDGNVGNRLRYARPIDWETLRLGPRDSDLARDQHDNMLREIAEWLFDHPRVKKPEFGCCEQNQIGNRVFYAAFVLSINPREAAAAEAAPATGAGGWPYRRLDGAPVARPQSLAAVINRQRKDRRSTDPEPS